MTDYDGYTALDEACGRLTLLSSSSTKYDEQREAMQKLLLDSSPQFFDALRDLFYDARMDWNLTRDLRSSFSHPDIPWGATARPIYQLAMLVMGRELEEKKPVLSPSQEELNLPPK